MIYNCPLYSRSALPRIRRWIQKLLVLWALQVPPPPGSLPDPHPPIRLGLPLTFQSTCAYLSQRTYNSVLKQLIYLSETSTS